ncbi:Nup85 nucleoporin-domain-containing protein [Scenedesmus sp. NREL 46B-D3]|nr:Nup85 nucleoporin-domain-containing protein [Scenedesmus sp. NREL 46B-D3]
MDLAVVQPENRNDVDGIEVIGRLPAAAGSRLQFSWGTGTEVRVCEVRSPATAAGGEESSAGFIEWSPPGAEQRRIAYDVMPLYKQLRKKLHMLGSGRQQEAREALQEYSTGVLAILTANARDPAAGPPLGEESLLIAYEAGLWQLLELFFLSSDTPEGFFAESFSTWLCHHGGLLCTPGGFHLLAAEARRLQEVQRLDSEAAYWPVLQRLVLTGQVEVALALLAAHPAYQALQDPDMAAKVEVLEQVFRLLRVVPRFSRQAGSSSGMLGAGGTLTGDVVVFKAERTKWRQQVDELWERREQLLADMKTLDPAAAKGIAGVLCLLCAGSDNQHRADASFKHAASIAHNWVELLAGTLLWKYPTLQPQLHLHHLLAKVKGASHLVSRQSDEEFLDFFEQLLLAASQQEVQTVIQLATTSPCCSLQFVAHIYDVLRASPGAERVISRPLSHFGGDQSEMYTLHYVETLAAHASTWQLAAEYLAWCPVHGSAVLEALLEKSRFPMQDDVSALKAVALAQRHGLTGAAAGLARRLGMAAAAGGRTAAALQWFMRAHDPARCAELVAPLLAKVQQQLLDQVCFIATGSDG